MHPILGRLRQLGLYLLAWIPLAGILVYLLARSHSLSWTEASLIAVPMCLVYAFLCLAAWYPCRATPIERSSLIRLLLTHFTAAVLVSALWLHIGSALAAALEKHGFPGLDHRLGQFRPLLWLAGVLLYALSATFYYVLLAEQASREAQKRALEAQVLARDAELKALRAQVNPHFLFNCLNSISALTTADSGKAREMCILLADFLRTTLRVGKQETITLQEELALIRSYLAIEKVRFGARVTMEEDIQKEAMNVTLPPLLLQPLVENAIRHGIANLPEGGVIALAVHHGQHDVSIEIENSFDPDMPAPLKTGLGLDNVRRRLHARYGDDADVKVRTDGNQFCVTLRLPAERNGDQA